MKQFLKKIIIPLVVCVVISLIYLLTNGFDAPSNYTNAFFVAGMVAVLVGGLLWVADMGTFDIFGYSFSNLKASFSKTVIKEYEDFPQYVEIKKEKRKKKEKIYLYLFVVGIFFVILSFIFRQFV